MSIQPAGNLPFSPSLPGVASSQRPETNSGLQQSVAGPISASRTSLAAGNATQASQNSQPSTREQAVEAVSRIAEFVKPINDSIEFSLDDDMGITIVKVIDQQTKEVLRQIPSEEAINIAKTLDKLKGLLIHNQA